jgi:hypothetical protein
LNPAQQFSSSKELIREKSQAAQWADGRVDADANCCGESSN